MMLPVHITAGATAIAAGAVALYAFKGGDLHRKSGVVFVYAMMVMSVIAAVMAATKIDENTFHKVNVIAAVLSFYLVTTALLTVRRRAPGPDWTIASALIVALTLGIFSIKLGFDFLNGPNEKLKPFAAAPFIFGTVALLAALGDLRITMGRVLPGPYRIARHLWRMCLAMFIATASFFLGQAKVFPEPLRIIPLLAIPVLLVLLLMLYWFVRVRFMKRMPRAAESDARRYLPSERPA